MTTPVDEWPEPSYEQSADQPSVHEERRSIDRPSLPSYNINNQARNDSTEKYSDEEGTVVGDIEHGNDSTENQKENILPRIGRPRAASRLTVATEYEPGDPLRSINSPSQTREQAHRLEDELALLKIERQVSKQVADDELSRAKSGDEDGIYRSKSRRRDEHVDEFDVATNPIHEKTQVYKPIEHPRVRLWQVCQATALNELVDTIRSLHHAIDADPAHPATPRSAGVQRGHRWQRVSRMVHDLARMCMAYSVGWTHLGEVPPVAHRADVNKKWRDMGKQLELPATLFFWALAVMISFLPTMSNHTKPPQHGDQPWMITMNKVLVSFFVAAILNFIEKIVIQLIAISFHLRTYADRIEINKFQIASLTKLYKFSKEKIAMEDYEFEQPSGPASGARTPGMLVNEAAKTTKEVFTRFGDLAGKVAGDFTGKQTTGSTHPHQVILSLTGTTAGAQVLARRLYRTFAREETETVYSDDLKNAFENDEEADAAFTMFDRDFNGSISMEELEAVCVEIGRERKSITASLKDLDSVVAKLDDVFMFVVLIIVILVFISLISTSAAGVLTSAGSAVLALSWLLSATAQELLQSTLFIFVKHPFDVGDRVSIYGNTGALGRGDDYFVKEISLLYTEFKKMEGHVVQAPNSYLNTLFIVNQRRSGGLAEAVNITVKFGTTIDQIDGLRNKLLEFVKAEKREYQGNILTELRDIVEVHSLNINVVFFYKSNWQNEGLRLARRNKFICALMVSMQELGIEGPLMRAPGQKQSFPMYLQNVPHVQVPGSGHSGHPDAPGGIMPGQGQEQDGPQDPPFVSPILGQVESGGSQAPASRLRSGSILKGTRARGESLSAMNRRVDFSLGASSSASGDYAGDVYEDRSRPRIPIEVIEASESRSRERTSHERTSREIAHTTSRESHLQPGNLARRSTDTGSRLRGGNSVHRNRFFGRGVRPGMGDEQGLMESGGMADIPEVPSTAGSAADSLDRSNQRMDPRSGMISTAAWRLHSNESNIHPTRSQPSTTSSGLSEGEMGAPAEHRPMGRSRTEDFEMRRYR
ncbi:hypothetical protein LTR57_012576 [Friedmanniomyces endolithicus]|nr:hypothetical protein LTR57_012576 [Friedmanniomyces endolithicus]